MKKLILMVALLALAVTAAEAQNNDARSYEDAVQVNGKAERKITPDEIWIAITIKDSDTRKTVTESETRMKREFAALGIDVEKALKVTSMANAPRKRNALDTSRSYELKVGDAAMLGRVFEVLGEMDVREAGVVRFSHSRIEDFRGEVRVEAIRNARTIASELAGALDQSIGKAVWIVDNGFYESSPAPVLYKTRAMAMSVAYDTAVAENEAAGALDVQEITLTCNVMAKFILR